MGDYGQDMTSFIAARFRSRRTELRLSLAEVAARADVHRSTVHLAESGQRGITVAVAARLSQALGLRLSAVVREAEVLLDAQS